MTPNQVVAYNVIKARALRGWTQERAAEALAPYLGVRLSGPSFSALERSAVKVDRIKQFSADDLLALSRGFDLPIGYFFTPPPEMDAGVHGPDAGPMDLDPIALLDAILAPPTTSTTGWTICSPTPPATLPSPPASGSNPACRRPTPLSFSLCSLTRGPEPSYAKNSGTSTAPATSWNASPKRYGSWIRRHNPAWQTWHQPAPAPSHLALEGSPQSNKEPNDVSGRLSDGVRRRPGAVPTTTG